MTDPLVRDPWSRPEAWARPERIHALDCRCAPCRHDRARPPRHDENVSAWSTWALAGIAIGNVIAFAVDAHGAWAALSAAVGSLLGTGR